MIVSAGLTPAWQQILLFDRFTPGEVNRAREAHWCASGKVLNVAVALHHLGVPHRTVCLVGGDSGNAIKKELAQLGLAARWVESQASTRVCTTILEAGKPGATELVENSAAVTAAELEAFLAAFREEARDAEVVVLSGSLPAGTSPTFYCDLMRCAGGRIILDARGSELVDALPERPYLVKPNREELERTVGHILEDRDALLAAMREVNSRGAEWVCITQGAEAVYLSSTTQGFELQPPRIEVVNPIGCGDCMAAGIAAALHQGADAVEAVRHGMSAAADNAMQLLPARLRTDRIDNLAGKIKAKTLG